MRNKCSGSRRRLLICGCVLVLTAMIVHASDGSDPVIDYLRLSIDWYQRLSAFVAAPVYTDEILYHDAIGQNALHGLKLGFDYARAQAALEAASPKPTSAPTSAAKSGKLTPQQLADQAAARVAQFQSQLDQLNAQIQSLPPTTNPANVPASQLSLIARRDKLTAALNLAKVRQQVIQSYQQFSSDNSGDQNHGLAQQVEDLASAVPQLGNANGSSPAQPVSVQSTRPENAGVIGLVGQLFALQHKIQQIIAFTDDTKRLAEANERLRNPLRQRLAELVKQSDQLVQGHDTDDIKTLDADRQQINSLTQRYNLLSSTVVSLREQSDMIESVRQSLIGWQGQLEEDYKSVARYLIVRLGAMATALLILMGVSKVWRKVTFRYVTDIRRRRQFLVVRRLVVGSFVTLILVGGVVTEFGSLATYAGLLTAGIAVALQTVILSGVAHFFLIGRYGVRVGDRVTISGITGDVIEIGIFRLYLMELGGSHISLQPTGRVVVFSNSVLFQPSPFYKQLPGAEYAWRELALTLSPDSDHALAEKQLMATVSGVFDQYKQDLIAQNEQVRNALHFQIPSPQPEGRLRFVASGLEYVIRYPVELRRADEIDDAVTRALIKAIEMEPKLKLAGTSTLKIEAVEA